MNCKSCKNYYKELDTCKFCHYEMDESKLSPSFDILGLSNDEWGSFDLIKHLWDHNIECVFADIFIDDILFILGCKSHNSDIARALGVSESVVYNDYEHMLVIVNLVEERMLRCRDYDDNDY